MLEFIKNRIDGIVPVFLLVFSFAYLSYNSLAPGGRTLNPFARAVQTLVSYPQSIIMGTIKGIGNFGDRYIFLTKVEQENKVLLKQLEVLRGEKSQLVEQAIENERLKKLLNFKDKYPASYITSTVIGIRPSLDMRALIINRGANDGVLPGMVVVAPEGVVGRIVGPGGTDRTSSSASLVLTILDRRSAIDTLIQRSRARGILRGNGYSLMLDFLGAKDDVKIGDTIVTSGMGGVFPKGLTLGKIVGEKEAAGGINYQAKVAPYVDFNHLEEVLIILKGLEEQ